MTDIDFEELDRAVQSAIDDFSDDTDQFESSPVITPASSNETTTDKATPASQSTSLPKKARAQRSLDSFLSPKTDIKLTPTVKPEVVQPEQKGRMIDIVNPIQRKPVHEIKRKVVDRTPVEETTKEQVSQEILDLEFAEDTKESPFIENLQVEKRPLGAFSKEKPAKTILQEKTAPVEEPTYIGGVDEAEELPPELQQDLLDIESTGMLYPQAPLSDENVGLTEAQQLQSAEVESSTAKSPAAKELQAAEAEDVSASTNIFASEAYSKPLEHPKKKKSGWFKVFLITLLFILGIAGGAAVYYFMI